MLLKKELDINQEEINEYKKLVNEVDIINEKISDSTHMAIISIFYSVICSLPFMISFCVSKIFDLDVMFVFCLLVIAFFLPLGILSYLEKNFFIDHELNPSKKMSLLDKKLIFFTNKRERKYQKLLEQREDFLLKIKNLEIDFERLEMLFKEQQFKLDISSNESVEYINAYNSYKNNLKDNNIVEALRVFTNYFENKDLSHKNLYNYI